MGGMSFDGGGGFKKNHWMGGGCPPCPPPIRGNPADCGSQSPAQLDLFISSDTSICSTMLLSQFTLTFCHTYNWMSCFIAKLMTILLLIGMIFVGDVPWEDIFKLCASDTASEFCECVQV